MKINKILLIATIVSISGALMPSCSESFLNEELTTSRNTDYFKTQAGLDDLSTGLYGVLKFKFNYIWGIEMYNLGVDEFTDASNSIPSLLSCFELKLYPKLIFRIFINEPS